uniref:Uncharacterized protein n=1 Tax=Panagrolaimus sp. ES5 TaxID=591445 RepID=A0AC34G0P1_9BILA
MVLNLGSGTVRLQATSQRVDDPRVWHSVQLERLGRSGSVLVDNLRTDFSTPGVSANLHLEDPIFIGGMPKEYEAPATVWSAQLKKGFIGCVKNVRINGINAQISKYFSEQADNSSKEGNKNKLKKFIFKFSEISLGCPSLSGSDYCATDPCQNGGICRNGHTTYHCDCAKTHFEGPRCNDDPIVYSFARRHGDAPRIRLPHQKLSQSEDVEIKFRTEDLRAVLIDTGAFNATDRFRLTLDHGRLELKISIDGSRQSFGWGEGLNDNQWHTVRVNRRGEKLRLFVDGKWENHYILPDGKIDLHIDELNVAEPLQPYENESEESISNDDFDGDIIKATFNEIDLLEEVRLRQKDRTSSEERSEGQRLKHRKVKSTTVWFDTNEGHLAFSLYRNTTQNGVKLALKFRTLSKKCLIFIIWNEKIVGNEVISLQLINGQLRLTRVSGSQLSTSTIKGKRWNDLKWHTLHLSETSNGGLKVSIENKSAEIDGTLPAFRSSGKLFLGGLPTGVSWPSGITQ